MAHSLQNRKRTAHSPAAVLFSVAVWLSTVQLFSAARLLPCSFPDTLAFRHADFPGTLTFRHAASFCTLTFRHTASFGTLAFRHTASFGTLAFRHTASFGPWPSAMQLLSAPWPSAIQLFCATLPFLTTFYNCSSSSSQMCTQASDGILRSPLGDSATLPTLGPSGSAERLNCCPKKRR